MCSSSKCKNCRDWKFYCLVGFIGNKSSSNQFSRESEETSLANQFQGYKQINQRRRVREIMLPRPPVHATVMVVSCPQFLDILCTLSNPLKTMQGFLLLIFIVPPGGTSVFHSGSMEHLSKSPTPILKFSKPCLPQCHQAGFYFFLHCLDSLTHISLVLISDAIS